MSVDRRVCGIVARNSIDFVTEAFRRLQAGEVIVTLRSESDDERVQAAGVHEVVTPGTDTGWASTLGYVKSYDDTIAQVQFTSGTEGEPKAIALSHSALATTTDRLLSIMQLDESVKEYVGVPVYYSFGFGRCRAISAAGGQAFIPEHGFDPFEVATMLGANEINALSAVPSLLRLILENPELFAECGNHMRWIEIGSQYMSRAEKEQLKALFPKATIVQHYGLTEASRSTFLKIHETEGHLLESVGKAYDGVHADVDSSGRIRVKGPHTATGTIRSSGTAPLVDDEGWLTTNDLGHMEEGYLFYDGRMDDVINCGGIKLPPEALEQSIRKALNGVQDVRVAKVADPLRGEAVLVAHKPDVDAVALRSAAEAALLTYGVQAGGSIHYFECDDFPVTETGKVRRAALTEQYTAQMADADNGANESDEEGADALDSDETAKLVRIWEEALGVSPVSVHDSFFDLGGDSLSAISVVMKFQKEGIPQHVAREILEGKSIAEIVSRADSSSRGTPLANGNLTVNAVRGFLVLCVIASHWMPGVVERLPAIFAEYNRFLSPFYSAGTPGFAIIFGVGLGFAYLPRYLRNPESVNPLVYRNALLLIGGILALGGTRIASSLAMGYDMSAVDYSNSFYGVLTYYLLAVLSIPIWLRVLSRYASIWIPCLLTAAGMYLIHLFIEANNPTPSQNPFVQTVILMFTAVYNYFELSAGVMAGLALGTWLRQLIIDGKPLDIVWQAGLLLVALAAFMGYESGFWNYWLLWPKPIVLSSWFFYAGSLLIALRLVLLVASSEWQGHRYTDAIIKTFSIIGILAFPLFIGHEAVIPFKDLLEAFAVPGALVISISIFFIVSIFLGLKLQKIFFARELVDTED